MSILNESFEDKVKIKLLEKVVERKKIHFYDSWRHGSYGLCPLNSTIFRDLFNRKASSMYLIVQSNIITVFISVQRLVWHSFEVE